MSLFFIVLFCGPFKLISFWAIIQEQNSQFVSKIHLRNIEVATNAPLGHFTPDFEDKINLFANSAYSYKYNLQKMLEYVEWITGITMSTI